MLSALAFIIAITGSLFVDVFSLLVRKILIKILITVTENPADYALIFFLLAAVVILLAMVCLNFLEKNVSFIVKLFCLYFKQVLVFLV